MEKLNILDLLLTYKNEKDKITILGKAIEMVIDYTDQIGTAFTNLNSNIQHIAKAITVLDNKIRQIDGELTSLKRNIVSNISKLEDTVTTSVSRLEDTVKETARTPGPASSSVAVAAPTQRTSIIEESLLKPSEIGKSLGGGTTGGVPSPLGGGMSIRSAMMAEIKQRLRASGGEADAAGTRRPAGGTTDSPKGEVGGGYVPKIHQPRAAKSLGGGLVSKMNKLLDTKFQKMTPNIGQPPSGPPSAGGPPMASPSAPPSVPPRAPPMAPPAEIDEKKKKKKKEKKKGKDKTDRQLTALERKIREKLG